MNEKKALIVVSFFLAFAFAMNAAFWLYARDRQAVWTNVPPVPSAQRGAMMMLGDTQLAYRAAGIVLQNLGDTGGRVTNFSHYDYDRLGRWFGVAHQWDSASNFMPYLAAYYFGAVRKDAPDLTPLIDYLAMVGKVPGDEKWRWLAQAVFMARYSQKDMEKAQELAYELADLYTPDKPYWVREMPVLLLSARGEKEAAYDLLIEILKDGAENMPPTEVAFIKSYICERILNKDEAALNPLCTSAP